MLRSDIAALLNGFDSRMKFINIVRAMLDYPMKNTIQEMVPDRAVLDNLIIMVLVYIKEQTLGGEQPCTIADISRFLEEVSFILPEGCDIDADVLARFIVTDVLQNGGLTPAYPAYDHGQGKFIMQTIRLVLEDKGNYHLTDEAFDFLFRSKEIESELDYSVTRFRLREYMKRDNYTQALDQSRELVSRIRNLKISMDDFLRRCREQLYSVTEDAYDSVITRIRTLLTDEEQELTDIRKSAAVRVEKLDAALQSGIAPEETRRHRAALSEIIENINLTIEEQRGLINKRYRFRDEFEQILRDHYELQRLERLDFKENILLPLQYMGDGLADAAKFLLFPLTKPAFAARFSPENFYDAGARITDDTEDVGIFIGGGDDGSENLVKKRNERYLEIMRSLFVYISGQGGEFNVSGFVASLSDEVLFDICEDNALPNVLLALYEIGDIDIEGWKAAHDPVPEPMGEFEPAWCLGGLDGALLGMRSVRFSRQDRTFSFTVKQGDRIRKIDMTDFLVEVVR